MAYGTRTAAGLPRRRPRRRQDVQDAGGGPPPPQRGTDVVVGLRRDPRPAVHRGACSAGWRSCPRKTIDLPRGRRSPRWTSTRCWPARPEVVAGRRAGPHQRARARAQRAKRWQDVEELLDAGITVITTVNIQHLESLNDVVAADHRGAAAGDRAGRGRPRRRAGRAGRHDPGGAAPADGARQHLPGRRRSTPRWATTSGSATSPRCASWPCCGWPTRSTTSSTGTAPSTASTPPGRPGNGSWSR